MDAALIASAALLGLAGTPHCAAMCAAPCAAVAGPGGPRLGIFLAARLAGYAAAGALAAGSVGALAAASQWSPALRPLWAALHVLVFALGASMLWQGRQPVWLGALGRRAPDAASGWQPVHGPVGSAPARGAGRIAAAAAAGALWVAWPCGLLQSALLLAALTGTAAAGAGAMASFALASSAGLVAAPWVWRWLRRGGAGKVSPATERQAVRAAGAMLLLASGFALGHGVWQQVAAYCGLG